MLGSEGVRPATIWLTAALLLTSCDKLNESDKNTFMSVIGNYLTKTPPCITLPQHGWSGSDDEQYLPFILASPAEPDLRAAARRERREDRAPFAALASAGLLSATPKGFDERQPGGGTRRVAGIAFDLTDAGKAARDKRRAGDSATFCYGTPTIDDILRYSGPTEAVGMKVSQVRYRYHLADLPDWATNPKVREIFPDIRRETAGPQERDATLILTNEGWKHQGEL